MQKSIGLPKTKQITVHYGIKWIAEAVYKPKEIMKWRYGKRYGEYVDKSDLFIAELIRSFVPSVTKDVFEGKVGDIKIVNNSMLILTTPPRPYEEWKYDFLKSDICVIGPIEKEKEITDKFDDEKRISIKTKKKAQLYVKYAKPYLDSLVENGLVNGILGRGSYFGKNGYPVKNDDIDFILLVNRLDKDIEEKILKILVEIPRFSVALVKHNDTTIKRGERPEMSFVIVSKDMAIHAKGNKYEKYVLADSMGIELEHLPKVKSEESAKKFISMLPKQDNRKGIPRFHPEINK